MNVEDFLSERHDLARTTKANYRMAFQALGKHVKDPYTLDRAGMTRALEQMGNDFKPASWNAYVNCIRSWYKWAYGEGEEYPKAVSRIKLKKIRRADYVKTKILREDEKKGLLLGCGHPRDRAFIAVFQATGERRGEVLNMRVGDLTPRPYGYDGVCSGKTGTHPIPPITQECAKILRVWLEHHPDRNNPEAPLWPRLKAGVWGKRLEPMRRSTAHNIIKRAAKAAGLTRNIHLHMFRHTENTEEVKAGVPAAARRKLHGWSENSNVPAIYEHLTDQESVNEVLKAQGLAPHEQVKSKGLVKCGYCGAENPAINQTCQVCNVLLDEKEARRLAERERLLDWLFKLHAEEYRKSTGSL